MEVLGQQASVLRVGKLIDTKEMEYFGLFPEADHPCEVLIMRSDSGYSMTVRSASGEDFIEISDCEYEVLARFLLAYETMGLADNPLNVLGKELGDASHERCFLQLMRKRVLSFTALQEPGGRACELVLHDGTHVSGIPLAVTESSVALWTQSTPFDVNATSSSLLHFHWSEVDS
ncbi:MAG: hypothetical protein C0600_00235, partial [Ignavibacteria bacterium]